jgi:hypothetical protein
MATPTLGDAFARAIFKGRNVAPNGMPVTVERMTQVFTNGDVEVLGVRIPVSGMGAGALRAGGRVAVAWQQGRPLVAIAHSARRTGAPVPLPVGGGGIVEELFIAGEAGARDVYFRNDQQVTALAIRDQLPSDPVRVRWGATMRHFVVETGAATPEDIAAQAEHPTGFLRVVKQYHVFEFTDGQDPLAVLGADEPSIERIATIEPYADPTVLFQLRTILDHQEREDRQKATVDVAVSADDAPVSGSFVEGTFNYVNWERELTEVAVETIQGPGSTQIDVTNPHTVAEILNGVNEENRLWFGDVEDFGTDLTGRLTLAIRASFIRVAEPTAGADVLTDSHTVVEDDPVVPCVASASTVSAPPEVVFTGFTPGGGDPVGARTFGESHYFLVALGAPASAVLWSTTGPTPMLSSTHRAATGLSELLAYNKFTGTTFPNAGLGDARFENTEVDAAAEDLCNNPGPTELPEGDIPGGVPFAFEFTDAFPNGYAARRMTLFDVAALPFIDTPVEMAAAVQSVARSFVHVYQNLSTENAPATPTSVNGLVQCVTFPSPAGAVLLEHGFGPAITGFGIGLREVPYTTKRIERTYVPAPIWTYRVRRARILDVPRPVLSPTRPVVALVVDRVRVATVDPLTFTKELGVFVLTGAGTLLTLRPFATTNPGGTVNDEFVGASLKDDGTDVELLSGNRYHVLWTISTAAERAANVRNIKLSRIDPGPVATQDVGAAWPEFQEHDFRVLNLDALYSAKEDAETGRRFVLGWDLQTGAPTLSQTAEGYPVDDEDLEPVQALADLNPDDPVAIARELQAVNDEVALEPTGRTLDPEPP